MIIVRDEFYYVGNQTNIKVVADTNLNVSELYLYDGNKSEVEAVIYSKNNADDQFNKYPCIILEMPYTVIPSSWNSLTDVTVQNLRILIVNSITNLRKII